MGHLDIEQGASWSVYWIPVLKQWVMKPPESSNLFPLYYTRQDRAWNVARGNAKAYKGLAVCYYQYLDDIRKYADYRERSLDEKVQTT